MRNGPRSQANGHLLQKTFYYRVRIQKEKFRGYAAARAELQKTPCATLLPFSADI